MLYPPLYDTTKSYFENVKEGPFGPYADGQVYEDKGEPIHDFFGHKVYLPFGIAAGPLPHSRFIKAAFDKGFDIATFKSVRTTSHPCHSDPVILPVDANDVNVGPVDVRLSVANYYKEPLTLANSFGVPSFSPEEWKPLIIEALQYAHSCKGKAMVTAFQGTDRNKGLDAFLKDHTDGIAMLKEIGADIIEVNLSCVNEGAKQLLCFAVDDAEIIIREVRRVLDSTPLILKINYFRNNDHLADFVKRVGQYADGIAVTNTISAELVDSKGKQAFPGGPERSKPGISGRAIKNAAIDMVQRLVEHRKRLKMNYKIVGIGGVLSPKDYKDHRNAGADSVMSVTGAMWNPYLAQEIKKAL